jgi:hypothetical protein
MGTHNNKQGTANMISCRLLLIAFLLLSCSFQGVLADQAASQNEALSQQIEELKQNVLDINSELRILEEQLFYPSSETSFYLSVDVGTPIRLVDINISLDGKHVAYHFYTHQEFDALTKGGIQRLFNSNVSSGRHTLQVVITGYDPQGKNYNKTFSDNFIKGPGRKYIELHVSDDLNTMQPKIEFREWDK